MVWHRKTQLQDYALLLLTPGTAWRRPANGTADGLELTEAIIRRVRRLADQAIPDAADLLATLTPAQIERMSNRMAEKNLSYAKEARLAEGEAGQRKARFKRLLERAEYWYGAFSDGQEAAIRQLIDTRPSGAQFWYDERLRRQNELLDLARKVQAEKPSRERVMALLRDYADRFDMPSDPSRRATALALRKESSELAAAIQALTTPAQREHARSKFDDLIREIGELAQEA
jgi:HAMP domain-containing protein